MNKQFRRQQWKMLLLTMLCYLFFYTGRHNFGWAAKGMSEALAIPYASIGWISAFMLIGYAVGQLVNGNIADKFSPKLMVVTGAYLSILTNFAISFSESFYMIAVLWTMNGYFQSMAWAPGAKIINNWWGEKERGKAFGFYTMSAGFSSVVTFLLSIVLLQQNMEWRMLFRFPVLLLLLSATIFLLFIKDAPAGTMALKAGTDRDTANDSWKERYQAVFKHKPFLWICLAFGFESMARYGLIFWVPVHYLGQDWKNNPDNLWAAFLLPVGMAAGALSFGYISDTLFKKDRLRAIWAGMLISAVVSMVVYISPVDNVILGAFLMFLAGFFVYGPQSCFWAICGDWLGSKRVATGIGIMNMFGYLFAALGEPLLGKLIDYSGTTGSIFLVIAFVCMLSVGIIYILKSKEKVSVYVNKI